MTLPDSYTIKPGAIPEYFKAIINAEAPERFSTKFLESLDFKSTNDRLFIGIMKDLGFIDTDGIPKPRYYELLDRSGWKNVLANSIKEAYGGLFAVNKDAQNLSLDEIKNKLRTLYAGSKKDTVIANIAKTFKALCEEADFTFNGQTEQLEKSSTTQNETERVDNPEDKLGKDNSMSLKKVSLGSLQYHVNIVLPESRDQAIYDAIFKALKDHLG